MNDVPSMRYEASHCLARARVLIGQNTVPAAREAALQLRLTIEYITYDQLQAYLKEVPNDALKKWTPKQVISEMLEVDPTADKSASFAIGLEHEYGVEPPPEEMQSLGEDRRFSLKWANKSHNALGNFLHAPTMFQIETGSVPTLAGMLAKANEIADECDKVLSSPIWGTNWGHFFEFECGECGRRIQRREGSFTKEDGVVCPNSECRAVYDVEPLDHAKVSGSLRQTSYTCKQCGQENWFGIHLLQAGQVLQCPCGKRREVRHQFVLVLLDS